MIFLASPVIWVLFATSVGALTIILLKLWQLLQLKPEDHQNLELVLDLWVKGRREDAHEQVDVKCFGADVLILAMRELSKSVSVDHLREELERLVIKKIEELRSLLPALEVIATVSPLLGLLGTVLGMIEAFQAMEAAGSRVDPAVLSSGIWQALLTTAIGLAVAIPTLAVFNWLDRKVQRISSWLSDSVTRLFTAAHGINTIELIANR